MSNIRAQDHPYLSTEQETLPMKLGINGAGRIGKLTIWHHVTRRSFEGLVVNIGREVGQGLQDVADYLSRDSTYGPLDRYLYGFRGGRVIEELKEDEGTMRIHGVPVKILQQERNPKNIPWEKEGVHLVADCTGVFRDPTIPADAAKGSLRGHLDAGVHKVILSAPFKIKDKSKDMPEDAVTAIQGINDDAYDPKRHHLISVASCTTTCLAFMVKPLLDHFGADRILSASMVTVHATTGSQDILDQLPGAGSDDLRKNRSIFNNIILTTTGAAKALQLVIPEMKQIGFSAESVRIPTNTSSIVILIMNIQSEETGASITPESINIIFEEAAKTSLSRYISYTERQNVSTDVIGTASAAIIEGRETRVETEPVRVRLNQSCAIVPEGSVDANAGSTLEIPVNQVVVYGWYDNELGSFCNMMGERTLSVAQKLL